MKKRSIWNKYGKKTAEYVNEWGKWYRFDTYADFGINIVVYIVVSSFCPFNCGEFEYNSSHNICYIYVTHMLGCVIL